MKQKLYFSFLILITFLSTILFCESMNPTLTIRDRENKMDLLTNQTILTNLSYDKDTSTTFITLSLDTEKEWALTINDMGSYLLNLSIAANGTLIHSYSANSLFQRVHVIEINPEIVQSGQLTLQFDSQNFTSRSQEVLSNRINAAPKIILSSPIEARNNQFLYFGLNCALIGILIIIIVISIFMFITRRKEVGYFLLVLLATIRLFTTLIDNSIIPITMQHYYQWHHLLVILPIAFNASIGIWLLQDKKMKNSPMILLTISSTILFFFVQSFTSKNWYHLFQMTAFISFVHHAYLAAIQNKKGWPILLVGYVACYTIVFYIYLVNIWNVFPFGYGLIYTNLSSFAYLPSLIACMIFISVRLVDKYNESEYLACQLEETNRDLDLKVAQRTQELIDIQNQRQLMMLNIFHSLRNPIFTIKQTLEKSISHPLLPEETLPIMNQKISYLQRLVTDLFLLAKLEHNEFSLFKDEIDCFDLLSNLLIHGEQATSRKIYGTLNPCYIWGDEMRIYQALEALLDSILVISIDDPIYLAVTLNEDTVCITFQWEHCLLKEKEIPSLFESYHTSYQTSKMQNIGLGFHLAKQIISLHQGTLDFTCNPVPIVTIQLPKESEE